MDTSTILAVLRGERDQLDFAIAALEALGGGASVIKSASKANPVRPRLAGDKRVLSAAARKKMSEAAKERWAKRKRAAKRAAKKAGVPSVNVAPVNEAPKKSVAKKAKGGITAAGRKRLSEALKARWAAKKRATKRAAKKSAAAPVATVAGKESAKA